MHLQIDVDLHYRFTRPNTVFLALEAARTDGQEIVEDSLDIGRSELTRIHGDAYVGDRIWARVPDRDMFLAYRATMKITRPDSGLIGTHAAALHDIPGHVAPYLRPSRYCQSDKFVTFVSRRFRDHTGGAKVAAIRDWIEDNLTYVPGSSDTDTNVLETFAGREGVCRDYAHLMCAMVRAAQIPARMVAVYSPDVTPPDFHAVTQVWLENDDGGAWYLVDPTGMCSADSMAVIAVGRDAYDIAFMDSEAPGQMVSQSVRVTTL